MQLNIQQRRHTTQDQKFGLHVYLYVQKDVKQIKQREVKINTPTVFKYLQTDPEP